MKNTYSLKSLIALGAIASLAACSPSQKNLSAVSADTTSIIGGSPVATTDVISKSTVAIVTIVQLAPKAADTTAPAANNTNGDAQAEQAQGPMQFVCTGTLIANNVVLTAGHCVYPAQPGDRVQSFIVFNTDLNKAQRADVRPVVKSIVHPDYGKGGEHGEDTNDLSLMKFSGTMADGYQIANFLKDESVLTDGATVTLAGYGLTDGVKKTTDNLLRKVDIQIAESFGKTEVVLDQSKGKGACHGDSGGPAFITVNNAQYVWGVTSRGIGKDGVDDCSLFSVYTKIKSQDTFVQAALKQIQN